MSEWSKAFDLLKANGGQTFAIAAAASILLILNGQDLFPSLPVWGVQLSWATLLVCGSLSLVALLGKLAALLSHPKRWLTVWYRRRTARKEFIGYLPFLTPTDRTIFSYLLHHNIKTFLADFDCGYAAVLLARGFVVSGARPGQLYDQDKCPFFVPDYVWEVLQERIDKFQYTPQGANDPEPWRIPWMAR